MDNLEYLLPGYDLSRNTVPQLRNILVAHNVDYPSGAKKGELIETIQNEILPQAQKLLRAQAKVKRTSRGITDVPSSQENSVQDSDIDDRDRMPPPQSVKTPRGRKSNTGIVDGEEQTDATPRRTGRSKTPNRRSVARTPRQSEVEPVEMRTVPSTKRTRKSTPGPVPVVETLQLRGEVQDSRRSPNIVESPFTQDNPFQSGSSPVMMPQRAEPVLTSSGRVASGRQSVGPKRSTKSSSYTKREQIEIPVSHLSTSADGVETTEEFTEDANEELRHDMAEDRSVARIRNTAVTRYKKKPKGPAIRYGLPAVLVSGLAAVAGWYRQEKLAVGYCGIGEPSWSLSRIDGIPDWVHETFAPQCEPCPPHAFCEANMRTVCERDYVLRHHPLSLNGVVPLPPTCEEDSEKLRRRKSVADKAVEELRNRRAAYECGDDTIASRSHTSPEESTAAIAVPPPSRRVEVSEQELRHTISQQRRKGMSDRDFNDLFDNALDEIKARDEIEAKHDKNGQILLSSSSYANLPFSCAVRRSMVRAIAQNRFPLVLIILLAACAAYGRSRAIQYRQAEKQTPALVSMTYDRLATQAALKEAGRVEEAFISIRQLRDDVLRNVASTHERERAWQRVRAIVEKNANVRASQREGAKTGEWDRVWEWIGPVKVMSALEGRQSGGMIESSPSGQLTEDTLRTWNEGRAIY